MDNLISENSEKKSAEKKFYLTNRKLQELRQKYQALLQIRNTKTKRGAPSILHSEELNPEYLLYLEDAEVLNMKMSDLEYILKNAELIKAPPKEKRNAVNLGAKVLVEVEGEKDEFEITGTLEANPSLGKISNESPVGRALLGHKIGDEVIVSSPIKTVYRINKIKYLEK